MQTPKLSDLLILARAKIAQGWCQRSFARNSRGERCSEDSPEATQWCAAGACYLTNINATAMLRALIHSVGAEAFGLSGWNDTLGPCWLHDT